MKRKYLFWAALALLLMTQLGLFGGRAGADADPRPDRHVYAAPDRYRNLHARTYPDRHRNPYASSHPHIHTDLYTLPDVLPPGHG